MGMRVGREGSSILLLTVEYIVRCIGDDGCCPAPVPQYSESPPDILILSLIRWVTSWPSTISRPSGMSTRWTCATRCAGAGGAGYRGLCGHELLHVGVKGSNLYLGLTDVRLTYV